MTDQAEPVDVDDFTTMSTSTEKKVLQRSCSSYSFRTPPDNLHYYNPYSSSGTRNTETNTIMHNSGAGSSNSIYDLVRSSFNVFRPASTSSYFASSTSNQPHTTASTLSDDFDSLFATNNSSFTRPSNTRKFTKTDRSRRRTLQEFQSVRLSEEPDDVFHSTFSHCQYQPPSFTTFAQTSREREREREQERVSKVNDIL